MIFTCFTGNSKVQSKKTKTLSKDVKYNINYYYINMLE